MQQGAAGVAERLEEGADSSVDLMTNELTPQETRDELDAMADETLSRLLVERPEAEGLLELSTGYAVFDTRKVVLFGLAAGAGRGVAVSRPTGQRIYMNMGTAGVGMSLGLGGFETQVVLLFQKEWDFNEFVTMGYDATAEAGTMFGEEKAKIGGPLRRRSRHLRPDQAGMEGLRDGGRHPVLGRQESQLSSSARSQSPRMRIGTSARSRSRPGLCLRRGGRRNWVWPR